MNSRDNPTAWCLQIREALSLKYDLARKVFFLRLPGEAVSRVVADVDLLRILTASGATNLEDDSVVFLKHPRRLLLKLRHVCQDDMNHAALLKKFVQAELVPKPGANVTSEEVWRRYKTQPSDSNPIKLDQQQFVRQLTNLVTVIFSLRKRHDIQRADASGNLTDRNGWSGLALRDTGAADSAGAAVVADTSDTKTENL